MQRLEAGSVCSCSPHHMVRHTKCSVAVLCCHLVVRSLSLLVYAYLMHG